VRTPPLAARAPIVHRANPPALAAHIDPAPPDSVGLRANHPLTRRGWQVLRRFGLITILVLISIAGTFAAAAAHPLVSSADPACHRQSEAPQSRL
jgi:hypothetical protein